MIKFFRHIRHTLINQNKMGKYFKYAIGEILLVMIGILLALQVNNWNESNRLLETQKVYLEQLLNDVIYMNEGYEKRLTEAKYSLNEALAGLKYLEQCDDNDSNKEYFDNMLLSHQVLSAFYSVQDTYDEMLSANVLSSLKNQELKNSIKDLYTSLDFSNNFISYFRAELGRASEIIWKRVSFTYDSLNQQKVSYKLAGLCNDIEFKNALVEVIDSRTDYLGDFERLLRKIKRLRNDLEKELNINDD